MKKTVKFLLLAMILVIFLNCILAGPINDSLHLNIQTTSSGSVTTGTFNFAFNISNSSNCAVKNIVYSNSTTLTTDSRGIISYYLDNINLDFSDQYWLCYYRDGVLVDTSRIVRSAYSFRAKNTTLSGVEVDSDLDLSNYNFTTRGGWTSGGVSILGGNIYAQRGYFYNITSLNISKQNLTVIDDFIVYGNTELKKNFTVDTNTLFVNSNKNRIGIGTLTPSQAFEVNGYILSDNFNTTGYNVFAGINSGNLNTANYVTAIGRNAGESNTGTGLTAVGYLAGYDNKGIHVSVVGYDAGINNEGDYLSALGDYAGNSNTGDYVVGVGYNAGLDNDGDYSIGIGYQALTGNNANNVIAIGYQAGIANLFANQFIVRQANVNAMPLIQGDFLSGNVGIGTSTPNNKLEVVGNMTVSKNFSVDSGTLFVNSNTNKVGIGTATPSQALEVNGTTSFLGDLLQSTGLSLFYDIFHTGRREVQAGNSGLGQGVPAKNKWSNSTSDIEYFDYSAYGNYKFSGGVFDGESIWLSPSYSDYVAKVNPASGSTINYAHGNGDYAFFGACYDGEKVWFAPFNSDNFMYILNNGTMVNITNNYGNAAFSGCVFTGREIVFIPEESDKIVAINPLDNSVRNVSNVDISATYAAIAFNGGFWDGTYVWMSPYNSAYIVRVNVTSGELTNYDHPAGPAAYVGALFDGVYGWFLPANNVNFLRLNPATGEMTEFPTGEAGGESFIGGCFDGINIWMAAEYADHILKFDVHSGDVNRYAHGKGNEAFRGCIFDGQHVWFVPFSSDSLGRIRPPEFGRDSLFTSGNLNVGGNVTIGGQLGITGASRISVSQGSAQTIPDGAITILEFETEDYDNLGEWNGTAFNAKESGYYFITGFISTENVDWTNSHTIRLWIYKNGVQNSLIGFNRFFTLTTKTSIGGGSRTIYLDTGDYVDLRVSHNRGANTDTSGSVVENYLDIHRLS